MRPLPLLLAALSACVVQKTEPLETGDPASEGEGEGEGASEGEGEGEGEGASEGEGEGASEGEGEGEGSTDLPDLLADLDTTHCEDVPGYENQAGATSYFYGVFTSDGDTWTGQEIWLLYATSEWEAEGGADCRVVWDILGSTSLPDACAGCDLAVSFSATLDTSASDCPAELSSGDETYDASYDVDVSGADATVYFSSSGNELGAGNATATAFNYLTDPQCRWF